MTKLWAMNPGLAVALSGCGALATGFAIHLMSSSMSANTTVEKAMEDERAVREPSSFLRHNTMNPKKN